jgi:2-phospho-L-lactate guanylyltransferase (CobY/MobA/RfbA family)
MKFLEAVLIPVFALIALTSPALAQSDLTPIANQLIDWLSIALMAGGSFVIVSLVRWLAAKTRMQDNEFEALLANRLNDILHRAIEHAVVVAKNEVAKPGSGLKEVKLDNFFLNVALNFAISRMPEIIDYFKLDEESIRQMILARMESFLNVAPAEGALTETDTVFDAKTTEVVSRALSPAA